MMKSGKKSKIKQSKNLSLERLLKLRAKMLKHAEIKKHSTPEDIASEYVTRLLEGRHQKATIPQAYIDIVRRLDANSKSKYFEHYHSLINPHPKSNEILKIIPEKIKIPINDKIDLKYLIKNVVQEKHRHIFEDVLLGLTNRQIAKKMKITESYVSLIILHEINRIKKHLKEHSRELNLK